MSGSSSSSSSTRIAPTWQTLAETKKQQRHPIQILADMSNQLPPPETEHPMLEVTFRYAVYRYEGAKEYEWVEEIVRFEKQPSDKWLTIVRGTGKPGIVFDNLNATIPPCRSSRICSLRLLGLPNNAKTQTQKVYRLFENLQQEHLTGTQSFHSHGFGVWIYSWHTERVPERDCPVWKRNWRTHDISFRVTIL